MQKIEKKDLHCKKKSVTFESPQKWGREKSSLKTGSKKSNKDKL
jgi:hypothetical protein